MGRMLGRTSMVLLVAGLNDFSDHQERRKRLHAPLREDYSSCTVTAEIDSFDRSATVAAAVVTALKAGGIRGIHNISQGNDKITRRIEEHGFAKDVVFICHDQTSLAPTTCDLLLARPVDVVIDQDPLLEARRAMELVLSHYGRLDAKRRWRSHNLCGSSSARTPQSRNSQKGISVCGEPWLP
jgi:LacI family transcriptional regulator